MGDNFAELFITDGSNFIDLLNHFHLGQWKPRALSYKDGGIMQSSSIGDRSHLVLRHYDNQGETFTLVLKAGHQKAAIHDLRRTRQMMELAADYQTGWSTTLVYIGARSIGENNLRYATIVRGMIPEDPDPYAAPFTRDGDGNSLGMVELTVEHWPWQETIPTQATAVELSSYGLWAAENVEVGSVNAAGTVTPVTDGRLPFVACQSNETYLENMQFTIAAAPGYSANVIDNPFISATLFDNPPNVGDALYISIQNGALNGFNNVVFDIGTASAGINLVWEYYNGAWVALTGVYDETNQFRRTGIRSLHFEQPGDWTDVSIFGKSRKWIRARVAAFDVPPVPVILPILVNRNPFTVVWPFVEIEADQVNGDIAALARHIAYQRFNSRYLSKIIVGLRSVSRGSDFNAYINFGGQNNNFISISLYNPVGTELTFVTASETPAGQFVYYQSSVGNNAMIWVDLTPQLNNFPMHYRGTFRAFVRCDQALASAGDITLQITSGMINGSRVINEAVGVTTLDSWQLVDLGSVQILTGMNEADAVYDRYRLEIRVAANAAAVAASATMEICDLILIPVDEWAGEFFDTSQILSLMGSDNYNPVTEYVGTVLHDGLIIDGTSNPKRDVRSPITRTVTSAAAYAPQGERGEWVSITNHYPILQVGKEQRLWFILVESNSGLGAVWRAYPWQACSIQSLRTQRYSTLRGTE